MHSLLPDLEATFDNHRLVSFIAQPKSKLKGFIVVHRGNLKTPAFGATRITTYENEYEALRDGLRLSKLMSYKAALAGVAYGGAKGVIIDPKIRNRKALLNGYAEKVQTLGGHFVTGADVGISRKDVQFMKTISPFFVGTTTDPVLFTAQGIYHGIKACLGTVYGHANFKQHSFAIQGLGKIGSAVLDLLYKEAKTIFVADIDSKTARAIKRRYPKIHIVDADSIHKQKVDVYVPCALSNALNNKTIPELRCQIVAGGANSQLETPEAGIILHNLGILYAPDYVINAGGLIAVVDEYEHKGFDHARVLQRVQNIEHRLKTIINQSQKINKATSFIADTMAEKIFNKH